MKKILVVIKEWIGFAIKNVSIFFIIQLLSVVILILIIIQFFRS